MLAHSASDLFWMTRYLERAEHTARMLIVQFHALEDRTVEEIGQYWRRIYQSIGRTPIGGDISIEADDEDFMLLDSFTLADDLTFELANTDSIRSSMYFARENARQIRHVIGRQLWTALNTAYLDLKQHRIENIWDKQPLNFYLNSEETARKLSGIINDSVYRDDGWHFLQLGRYIERTQILASLLDAQIKVFATDKQHSDSVWNSLLYICNAQLAYRRKYSLLSLEPKQVLDFLIADSALPRSIQYSLKRTLHHLEGVSDAENRPELVKISHQAQAIVKLTDNDWRSKSIKDQEICETLRNILKSSQKLSDQIATSYFFY